MCVPSGAMYCRVERSCISEDYSRTSRASGGVSDIERSRIKRIEMRPNVKRLKSFDCNHNHVKDIQDLALAGFYCAGPGDCVRCFYCGGGLSNWLQEDDVWVEHARWFPNCGYLKEQMGQWFIDTVKSLSSISEQVSLQEVETRMEAQRLRTRCRICNQRGIEVTYYTCGHMACYQCAHTDRTSSCHACGRDIMRRIQTRLHN